ncbi:hypothetical protein NQ318_012639 [Aromia moschata]|uniref:Uncharacterized protein n=1 Tax=Aromia moschata TaxID=1265417 RepID=A0AAV8X1V2_9CUCU|nr:hypothetical protein NQ318_012639 [Aromia moschata]
MKLVRPQFYVSKRKENYHPYKFQLVQELNEDDPDRRLQFLSRLWGYGATGYRRYSALEFEFLLLPGLMKIFNLCNLGGHKIYICEGACEEWQLLSITALTLVVCGPDEGIYLLLRIQILYLWCLHFAEPRNNDEDVEGFCSLQGAFLPCPAADTGYPTPCIVKFFRMFAMTARTPLSRVSTGSRISSVAHRQPRGGALDCKHAQQ